MRRVLRQVITGLVSILLDAILQSSGGGGGGGQQAGAREGGGGGAGRGGARAARGPVREQARPCACVSAYPAGHPLKERARQRLRMLRRPPAPASPRRLRPPAEEQDQRQGGMGEPGGWVGGQGNIFQAAVARKFLLCT